jgi:hypothetical protein
VQITFPGKFSRKYLNNRMAASVSLSSSAYQKSFHEEGFVIVGAIFVVSMIDRRIQ